MQRFKSECKSYLQTLGIGDLRSYGRYVGVERPTTKNKEELIDSIIAVLVGEISPIPCSKLGAPVLNKRVDPNIIEAVEALRLLHTTQSTFSMGDALNAGDTLPPDELFIKRYNEMKERESTLWEFQDPNASEYVNSKRKVHTGQLETLNAVPFLLPLDCTDPERQILVPVEVIHEYSLQEGDVIDCHVDKGRNCDVAMHVEKINGIEADKIKRNSFQNSEVCYPSQIIELCNKGSASSTALKFLQWILPIGKGQRALLTAAPKTGKTHLLQEIAKAAKDLNDGLEIIVLLVDQSPEIVAAYRKSVDKNDLLYTTYDHDPDRQVFVAEFALKRAKAMAECGRDVLLLVDSFNSLARAYNDTEQSSGGKMLACGLESKTIQYLKKYFGTARCLEKGGSITIVGAVTTSTGNSADEYLSTELATLGNLELSLDEKLAYKRVYPALDVSKAYTDVNHSLLSGEEQKVALEFCGRYVAKHGIENALRLLAECDSFEDFTARVMQN